LESPADIDRIHHKVHENSMDLLQADHTLSGIDVALWDALGKLCGEPVFRLLGYPHTCAKIPYASMLLGDTPHETFRKAQSVRQSGFRAAKFGWGSFGRGELQEDIDQVMAAREGIGPEGILCIDAGTVWGSDVESAARRIPILEECQVTWLEEPFHTGALSAYKTLAAASHSVKMAGGEGAHNEFMAQHMIDYAGVGYIQIDTGRIGGITPARRVADYASARGVRYVNHTFTSHLALSASLQPYAGLEEHVLCEYPGELKSLAAEMTLEHLIPNANGEICAPERLGLGMTVNEDALRRYLVDARIEVNGQVLYQTPTNGIGVSG
nr:mandelate racemase/muconate lactonizing enzyme family protein [Anaerolinea sp.]